MKDHLWDPEIIALKKLLEEGSNPNSSTGSTVHDPLFDDEPGNRFILDLLAAQSPQNMRDLITKLFSRHQIEQAKKRLIAMHMLANGSQYAHIRGRLSLTPRSIAKLAKKLKAMGSSLSPTEDEN